MSWDAEFVVAAGALSGGIGHKFSRRHTERTANVLARIRPFGAWIPRGRPAPAGFLERYLLLTLGTFLTGPVCFGRTPSACNCWILGFNSAPNEAWSWTAFIQSASAPA